MLGYQETLSNIEGENLAGAALRHADHSDAASREQSSTTHRPTVKGQATHTDGSLALER